MAKPCESCVVQGRCINGWLWSWSTLGEKRKRCYCMCHFWKRMEEAGND